jgi:hypothetical protein
MEHDQEKVRKFILDETYDFAVPRDFIKFAGRYNS